MLDCKLFSCAFRSVSWLPVLFLFFQITCRKSVQEKAAQRKADEEAKAVRHV